MPSNKREMSNPMNILNLVEEPRTLPEPQPSDTNLLNRDPPHGLDSYRTRLINSQSPKILPDDVVIVKRRLPSGSDILLRLEVAQHPDRALATNLEEGVSHGWHRIQPAPVVCLNLYDAEYFVPFLDPRHSGYTLDCSDLIHEEYFIYTELVPITPTQVYQPAPGRYPILVGDRDRLIPAEYLDGAPVKGIYAAVADVGIITSPGRYQLAHHVMLKVARQPAATNALGATEILATIKSAPFTVYAPGQYPGDVATSELERQLAAAGLENLHV